MKEILNVYYGIYDTHILKRVPGVCIETTDVHLISAIRECLHNRVIASASSDNMDEVIRYASSLNELNDSELQMNKAKEEEHE